MLALNLVAPIEFAKVVCSGVSPATCARIFLVRLLSRFQSLRAVLDCDFCSFFPAEWLIAASSSDSLTSFRSRLASYWVARNPATYLLSGPRTSSTFASRSCFQMSFSISPFCLFDGVLITMFRMYLLSVSCVRTLFRVFRVGSGREVAPYVLYLIFCSVV